MVNVDAVEDPDALLLVDSNRPLQETEKALATGPHQLATSRPTSASHKERAQYTSFDASPSCLAGL